MADENRVSVELVVTQKGFELFDQAGKKVGEFSSATGKASGVVADALKGIREGFDKELEAALRAAQAHKSVASSFSSLGAKIVEFNQTLDLTGRVARGVEASISGVFAGINRGADLDDLSQRLGVAVEQLSSLELSAKLGGVSMESMGTGLQALSRNMAAAASGSKEAQAAFAAVGISAEEIGKLRTDEVLERIAEKFAGAQDGADKTALAMDLLGKAGAQMIPVLNAGSEGLSKNAELARQLGLVLDGETAKSMGGAADAADILSMAVTGVQNQLAIGMAPSLEHVAGKIVQFVANVGIADGRLQDLGDGIGSFVDSTLSDLIDAFNRVSERARDVGWGNSILEELGSVASKAKPAALGLGREVGAAIADGVKAGFRIDWSSLLGNIPIIGIGQKIGEAFKAATSEHFPPEVRAAIDEYNAAVLRAQSAQDALARSEANSSALTSQAGETYVAAGGDVGVYGAAAQQAAEKTLQAAEAAKKGSIGYQQNGDAAKKAADEIAKLRDRFAEQIRTQTESVTSMEGQNEALQQIVDGNLSAADAQTVLNDATGEAAALAALATGATADEAVALGNLAISAAEAAQKNRDLNAIRNAQNRTQDLQLELTLTEQVNQGLISELDKKIQIARAQADGNAALADQLEKQVRIQDAIEDQKTAYLHLGDVFKDSFNQAFDAVISGTRDMGDVLEGIGIGIGKRFFSAMLDSKLKDFDPTVKANFLELGGYGQNIFSKLFSGGSGVTGSTSDGAGLFKQASDWIGGLFGGASSSGGVDIIGQNADGSYIYSDGSEGYGQSIAEGGGSSGGGFGAGAASAAAGAVTAYSLFRATDDTKLEGLIAKGTESGVIHASNAIGQIVGTIVGAVASIYLGPVGGIAGAAIGSGLAALIAGSVDRNTFLKGEYTGFVGLQQKSLSPEGAWVNLVDPNAFFHYKLTDWILNLPTLGLAMRKGAEAVLDGSKTFQAAQSKWGDITVRSGGPRDVYRNNLTGADTARERGFTDAQVKLTTGATAAIFNQIADGEVAEDAGRLGEAMGNIMAEFLSRGLKDGVDFEPMFDLLRQFAHEAGIDVLTTLRSLNDTMANSIAAAEKWGHLDPMAAAAQGARAYAEALVGATAVFEKDYPQGVHLASIALRNLEKDGVNAFGEIDDKARETLFNLSKDTELTTDIIAKLIEQGFTINTDEFERELSAISQSAALIGQNIGEAFNFNDAAVGVQAIFQSLKNQIYDVFSKESIKQLFDTTDIASAFEPVFLVLDRIDEFDLTTATGSQQFMDLLLPALAEGKANLQSYIPVLQVMADNWKEIQKIIDEAMKPDIFEQAAKVAEEGFNGLGGVLNDAITAGIAVLEDGGTWDDALNVFNGTFGAGIEKSFKDAIFNAIVNAAVIQPLIAQFQPALEYVIAAGFAVGFSNPKVREAIAILLGQVNERAKELGVIVFQAKVDSDGITSGIEKAFNDAADITVKWADDLKSGIHGALDSAFDVLASGGSRDEALAAWSDALGSNTKDAVLRGIVLALIDAAIIEPFIKQWAPIIQWITAGAVANGWYDPKVQEAIDKTFGPGSKFMNDLNNIGPVGIDIYGRIIGYTDENGNPLPTDGSGTPGLDLDGSQTGGGKRKPPGRSLNFAAAGGTFPLGDEIIVGENGPERVTSGPDGVTVTPLSAAEAQAVGLDPASTQGRDFPSNDGRHFPTNPPSGGGRTGPNNPIDLNPHSRDDDFRNPTTRPRIPPPPGQHPGTSGIGTVDVQVALNLDDAIEAFLRGGSLKDFEDALDEGTKKAVLDGVIKGMLESGPIKKAIDDFNKQMDDAVTKAMRDGVIDGQEQADLDALAKKLSGGIETATKQMQPVVESLGKAFGIGIESSTKEAIDGIASDLDGAIRAFLEGGSVEDMQQTINRSIYDATTSAIIQALITTGPLAGIIEDFGRRFGNVLSDAMEDGVLSPKEQARLEKMAAKFGIKLSDAVELLGPLLGPMFGNLADEFGIDLQNQVADINGILGNAVRQGLLNGDSFATFAANVKQALYESIVDGLVKAFIDSAVVNGLLAGPLAAINLVFKDIADGQIDIVEASARILAQTKLISDLLKDPTFKQAWDLVLGSADDIRKSLGITSGAAQGLADGFQGVADTATDATKAECEWERRLVEGQEKNATLDEFGRQGFESVESWQTNKPAGSDPTPYDMHDTLGGDPTGQYGFLGTDRDWRHRGRWLRRQDQWRRDHSTTPSGDPDDMPYFGHTAPYELPEAPPPQPPKPPRDDRDFVGPHSAATNSGPMPVKDEATAEMSAKLDRLEAAIRELANRPVLLDGREISKNSRKHERRESRGAQSTQWGIS